MPTHKQTTGEWKTAGYLLIEMRREGQTPDAASYAAAMKVGTAGDGLVGCSVYRIHAQLLFTYLHTVTINHPHQTQACLEAGEKQRALGLWDEMVASGVRAPSKETLSLAMAAALDLRDWDRIDTLLALNSASVRVDQRFFSDMMAGFVQSGRWGSALNLLRVLGEGEGGADGSGGVSQRVTAGFYEQVRLVVVGWNGVVGLVIWLVWTHPFFLPLDPPPPPHDAHTQQAVHACCVAGATDAAVRTLDEMALMGFAPSTFIYNVAMEACARTGVRRVLFSCCGCH